MSNLLDPIYNDLGKLAIAVVLALIVAFIVHYTVTEVPVSPTATEISATGTPTAIPENEKPEDWVLGLGDVMLVSLLVSLCTAGIATGLIEAWVGANFERKR